MSHGPWQLITMRFPISFANCSKSMEVLNRMVDIIRNGKLRRGRGHAMWTLSMACASTSQLRASLYSPSIHHDATLHSPAQPGSRNASLGNHAYLETSLGGSDWHRLVYACFPLRHVTMHRSDWMVASREPPAWSPIGSRKHDRLEGSRPDVARGGWGLLDELPLLIRLASRRADVVMSAARPHAPANGSVETYLIGKGECNLRGGLKPRAEPTTHARSCHDACRHSQPSHRDCRCAAYCPAVSPIQPTAHRSLEDFIFRWRTPRRHFA